VDQQATVRSYDGATRSGTVFFDDGTIVGFDAAAYDVGGLRLLRPGQRVRVRVVDGAAGPQITALTLATFAFQDEH
jgi:cold shock CspA family protein